MKNGRPENYESRMAPGSVEVREAESGAVTIRGLAAVFDSLSENLGGFREQIAPGAFDETDIEDVRGLFNHDVNFVLGRTKTKTVRLKATRDGLEYEIDLPDTALVRDLVLAPIKRGDIDQSSFGFIVGPGNDSWDENEDGVMIRTISKVSRLMDVSPVTFPAYQDTTVAARSFGVIKDARTLAKRDAERSKERGDQVSRLMRRAELPRL